MDNMNINDIEKNTIEQIYSDGMEEIRIGSMIMYLSIILFLTTVNIVFLFLIFTFPAISQITNGLKAQYSHPRVGYAKLDMSRKTPILKQTILLTTTVILLITGLVYLQENSFASFNWFGLIPILIGMLMGITFNFQRSLIQADRYTYYIILSVLGGLMTSLISYYMGIGEIWLNGINLFLLVLGGIILIDGYLRFRQFITLNPVEVDEKNIGHNEE